MSDLPVDLSIASDDEVLEYIRQNYGYLAGLMDEPDVRNVVMQAAREGWDEARIQGALSQTPWWQTHSDTQRQLQAKQSTDPMSVEQELRRRIEEVTTMWIRTGGAENDQGFVLRLAQDSITFGWTEDQLRRAIVTHVQAAPGRRFGEYNIAEADLKQMAADYGVPVSPQVLDTWAAHVTSGTQNPDAFRTYVISMAKSMYQNPELHQALDAGISTRQYADPFVNIAAQDLAINPANVSLSDPKWNRMLQVNPDTGAPMTLYDWQKVIRNSPEYGFDNSPVAIQAAAELETQILKSFGRM